MRLLGTRKRLASFCRETKRLSSRTEKAPPTRRLERLHACGASQSLRRDHL
jgi:hypothetical protein